MNKESVKEFLIEEISRDRLDRLNESDEIDGELFVSLLWEIMISNTHPYAWRAAWTMFHYVEKRKELSRKYLTEIIELLPHFKHNGQKREMMKVLLLFPMKELDFEKLIDICFNILINPKENIAVRVHAMQIIFNIGDIEPDIRLELKIVLEDGIQNNESKGFVGRAKKLLKKMA